MGGSSWGHKGGVLGAVPLERKTPGFLAFGLCGFSSGFSVWGCLFGVGGSASVWLCWGCACLFWWFGQAWFFPGWWGFFAYICSRDTLCHVILQLSFLFDLLLILRADTFLLIVSVPDTLSL